MSGETLDITITDSIYLRVISKSDIDELKKLIEENRDNLRLYFNWVENILQKNAFNEFVELAIRNTRDMKGITWVIIHEEKIIGSISLYDWIHDVNKISIGFWLDKNFRKKGIISTCLDAVLRFVFEDMNVLKVEMYFSPKNKISYSIAEKFGFRMEGLLRNNFYINGNREDQYIAGLLHTEWKKKS